MQRTALSTDAIADLQMWPVQALGIALELALPQRQVVSDNLPWTMISVSREE
jgi:hypothetical protein